MPAVSALGAAYPEVAPGFEWTATCDAGTFTARVAVTRCEFRVSSAGDVARRLSAESADGTVLFELTDALIGAASEEVASVTFQIGECGASSALAADPCTLRVLEFVRGTAPPQRAGESELGSRLRARVSCPAMLPYWDDDHLESPAFSPTVFEVEATNCGVRRSPR